MTTNFQLPYRAIICGEEHIVNGWQGRKLVTKKGRYFVGHIYGNWQIENHRILEVALIQSDGKGGWLVNGKPLSFLDSLPMSERLLAIPGDENLRVYKDKICAVAWFDLAGNSAKVTDLLDEVIKFWNRASLPPIKSDEEPSVAKLFYTLTHSLHNISNYRELCATWSKPVWLTEFRHAAQKIPISSQQKQIVSISTELLDTKAQLSKAKAIANGNLKEALSKWMRFDPPRMSADTKARIEKAVKLYLTDPEKRSLKKIGDEFGVSRKTVSVWFKQFAAETGYPVVTHRHHISVREQSKLDLEQAEEE
jgi:hypothetical protein